MEEEVIDLVNQIISAFDSGRIGEAYILIDDAYCMYPEYMLLNSPYAELIHERLKAIEKTRGFDLDAILKRLSSLENDDTKNPVLLVKNSSPGIE